MNPPQQYFAANLAPAILATVIVLARLYTRTFVIRSWEFEDYIIVLALVKNRALTMVLVAKPLLGIWDHKHCDDLSRTVLGPSEPWRCSRVPCF